MISPKTMILALLCSGSLNLYGMEEKKETTGAQIYIKDDVQASESQQPSVPNVVDDAAARSSRRKNLNAAKAFVIKHVPNADADQNNPATPHE